MAIGVVVVESHQHVLEHIHSILRQRSRRILRRKKDSGASPKGKDERHRKDPLSWTLVHFDSHPDLACPGESVPASSCFTPRASVSVSPMSLASCRNPHEGASSQQTCGATEMDLYEMLDLSQSGIAEWILPLTLAANLDKVHWVKSPWADQFRVGRYRYRVGAYLPPMLPGGSSSLGTRRTSGSDEESPFDMSSFLDLPPEAVMKVDLQHPYYYDDSSVVDTKELLLAQPVDLVVSELAPVETNAANSNCADFPPDEEKEGDGSCWMLDICLDYFACLNPFLTELFDADEAFAAALVDVASKTRFRCACLNDEELIRGKPGGGSVFADGEESIYERELHTFHILMEQFFQYDLTFQAPIRGSGHTRKCSVLSHDTDNMKMQDSAIKVDFQGARLTKDQYDQFFSLYPSRMLGLKLLASLEGAISASDQPKRLATMAMQALPSITMPHPSDQYNMHKRSQTDELLQSALGRVKLMGDALTKQTWGCRSSGNAQRLRQPPAFITVARSSNDGFTPPSIVEELQQTVLECIHTTYCGCNSFAQTLESCLANNGDTTGKSWLEEDDNSQERQCALHVVFDYGEWEGSTLY